MSTLPSKLARLCLVVAMCSLTGKLVSLTSLTPDDLDTLNRDVLSVSTGVPDAPRPDFHAQLKTQLKSALEKPATFESDVYFGIKHDDELVGYVVLKDISAQQRSAAIFDYISPDERGKGYASEAIRLLLDYAFRIRGLHRVSLWTITEHFKHLAEQVGFTHEGVQREAQWHDGQFRDRHVYGMLAHEFKT